MKNVKWLWVLVCLLGVAFGFSRLKREQVGTAVRPPVSPTSATSVAKAKAMPLLSVTAMKNSPRTPAAPVVARASGVAPAAAPFPVLPVMPAPVASVAPAADPFAAFNQWAEQYLSSQDAGGKRLLTPQGRTLAQARRQALARLVREDPERALTLMVPYRWRQELPLEVSVLFERAFSGHGDYEVISAMPRRRPDGSVAEVPIRRYVRFEGQRYTAFVYGRRERAVCQKSLALHGLILDQDMALHEDPLRIMDSYEAKARIAAEPSLAGGNCHVCGVALAKAAGPLLMDLGGQVLRVCGYAHAVQLNQVLGDAEGAGVRAGFERNPAWTNAPPVSPSWSIGTKRLLYIRIIFPDDTTEPITEGEAVAAVNKVSDFYAESSFNKTAVIPTVTPLLMMPQPKMYYMPDPGPLLEDAREVARQAGFHPDNYEFDMLRFTQIPGDSYAGWAGMGYVGGKGTWLQDSGAGVAAHELGHNYGLWHANYWRTQRPVPIPPLPPDGPPYPHENQSIVGLDNVYGPGQGIAYGDWWDMMGFGQDEGVPNAQNFSTLIGHFGPIAKRRLGWLPDANMATNRYGATNRLYVHDVPRLVEGRNYALVVDKDLVGWPAGRRSYWVNARGRTQNPWIQNGVMLHWGQWMQNTNESQLLDTTPGTHAERNDAPILTGRTFSDTEADVHITPFAKGGSGTNAYYDVVVNFGPISNNVPPVLELQPGTNQVMVGIEAKFTAVAADANDDALSYFWDFGDGSTDWGKTNVSKAWVSEGDYVVRCEVSDMRGGLASQHFVIRVGVPTNQVYRISGLVRDTDGRPVQGAWVHNGRGLLVAPGFVDISPYYADDYQSTVTDSDGRYSLVNLMPGQYQVEAYLHGYWCTPFNFERYVTLVDADADDAQLLLTPWPRVTIADWTNANKSAMSDGFFTVTRTGDTNTELHVVCQLGGTALAGTDYKSSATNEGQTNFWTGVRSTNFFAFGFATGVVSTNVTIAPSTNASANAGDKTVILSITYPLQSILIQVTNEGGTTLTNTNVIGHPSWDVVAPLGENTYIQTRPPYLPVARAEKTILLKDRAPSTATISIVAVNPNVTENLYDAAGLLLTRFGRVDQTLNVSLGVGGTATPGVDYAPLPATVTFAPGQESARLPLVVFPDLYLEGNETVEVTVLTNVAYTVGTSNAVVTILDNDLPMVTVNTTDPITAEAGGQPARVVLTRTGDMLRDVTVNYLVMGSAIPGRDYRALPGRLIIPAGQPSGTISVAPMHNPRRDGDKSIVILVGESPVYNVGFPNTATVILRDGELPTVTVTATIPAAAEPSGAGEFTITRQGDLSTDLWVALRAVGNAKSIADYSALPSRIKIPALTNSVAILVTPAEDRFSEHEEWVVLEVMPSSDYNVGIPAQAMVTIAANGGSGPAVGFAALTSSVIESVGTGLVAVIVSANPAQNNDVTVDWLITGGSARPGIDFPSTSVTGRLYFPHDPLDTRVFETQFIELPILDNTNAEPDRTIVITLVEPFPIITNEVVTNTVPDPNNPDTNIDQVVTNIVVTPVPINGLLDAYITHILTIRDDDASVINVIAQDAEANEEGLDPAMFRITRSGATNRSQLVTFQWSGLAANGSDYETIDSWVVIPPGPTAWDIPVYPVDDPQQEFMEDVILTLIDAPGCQLGTNTVATVYIIDNDGAIEFPSVSFTVPEGIGTARVPVKRTGATNGVATVDYTVTAGTATAGADFVLTNGTLVFYPGETNKYIEVVILDDGLVENPETVNLALSNPTGGVPLGGQGVAVLVIQDDDCGVEFAQPFFRIPERQTNAVITVRRIGVLSNALTVDFLVTNGTATDGLDFAATNGTLTFAAGQQTNTFTVHLLDDVLFEGDETAKMSLTNLVVQSGSGGASLTPQAVADLVIADDECSLDFAEAVYYVDEYARVATLTVRRLGGTVNSVSVDYATKPGTAKASDYDYKTTSGTLTFAGDAYVPLADGSGVEFIPGQTNQIIEVRILDDVRGEGDEYFTCGLFRPRGPTNALPASTVFGVNTNTTVWIIDNETPGSVDYEYDPGQGANGPVLSVALQPDGKLLLAGEFTAVDGKVLNHVARLHSDGYLDSSFDPGAGADDTVRVVALQPDGKVLLGGDFTEFHLQNYRRLVRLNADGALDRGFDTRGGPDGPVNAIVCQEDGKILIGGAFNGVGTTGRRAIARLNPDGSLDDTFGRAGGVSGEVMTLVVLGDGKILVGGSFGAVGGALKANLARLNPDGSLDATYITGSGPGGAVRSMALRGDNRLMIAGDFSVINGVNRNRLARLNADGSLDASFDPQAGPDDIVYSIAVQDDNKIVIGGAFTNYGVAIVRRFARLEQDGVLDADFKLGAGANDTVRTVLIQPNTAVILGGDFTEINKLPRNHIARVHGDEFLTINKIQFSAAFYRIGEAGRQATIAVRRSGDLLIAGSVDYETADGSATAGLDYQTATGTLQFGAGETEKTFTVTVLDDRLAEGDETINLRLFNLSPTNTFSTNAQLTAVLTIEDDESAIAFASTAYTVNEGAGSTTVTIRRAGPSTNVVSVDLASRDGTATAGQDYVPIRTNLVFGVGENEKTYAVRIVDDDLVEGDETFTLELSNPGGTAVLGSQTNAVITILDNDRVPFYSLNVSDVGGGTVTPPAGPYPSGTNLVVTAWPDPEFIFDHWEIRSAEGVTNTTDNPIRLTMDKNYTVSAFFRTTAATYTFEYPFGAAQLLASPWSAPSGSKWQLQSSVVAGGQFALRSGPIGDLQQSALGLVVDSHGGTMAFDVRVSSEKDWDYLEFTVDGVRVRRWSGEEPWQSFQYRLSAGRHVLVWRYVKDSNFSAGLDAAFLDNVYLPITLAQLTLTRQPDGSPRVKLQGRAGLTYVLEASSTLLPRSWVPISTNTVSVGTILIDDPQATNYPARFYRAFTP